MTRLHTATPTEVMVFLASHLDHQIGEAVFDAEMGAPECTTKGFPAANRFLAASGLGSTTNERLVLWILLTCGSQSMGSIASLAALSRPAISMMMDRFEKRGWVRLGRGEHDRRYWFVSLTDDFRKRLESPFDGSREQDDD